MRGWHRLLTLTLIFALVFASLACTREETSQGKTTKAVPSRQQYKQDHIQWFSFNDGLAKAKHDNKPMFVEIYTDWCPYCKKFHKETLRNTRVASTLADNFIAVRLNAEDPKSRLNYQGLSFNNVEFTRAFGVMSYPSLLFLETSGEPITIISGFVPAPQFLAILNYIGQKCYLTRVSLNEFVNIDKCN